MNFFYLYLLYERRRRIVTSKILINKKAQLCYLKLALAEKSQPAHLPKTRKYVSFPKVVIKSLSSGKNVEYKSVGDKNFKNISEYLDEICSYVVDIINKVKVIKIQ